MIKERNANIQASCSVGNDVGFGFFFPILKACKVTCYCSVSSTKELFIFKYPYIADCFLDSNIFFA